MDESQTCFSLIEKLTPLKEEYGEEQIVAALFFILQQDCVSSDDVDELIIRNERMEDLKNVCSKWESQNGEL